jgi:hypothetical protein
MQADLSVTSLITPYANCKIHLGEFNKVVLKNELMVLNVQETLEGKSPCKILQWLHQWRTQKFFSGEGGGSTYSVEGRENRDRGGGGGGSP